MKKLFWILLILAIIKFVACESNPIAESEDEPTQATVLNLDFEQVDSAGKPVRWYVGGEGYEVKTDTLTTYSGSRSLRMNYISGSKL